MSNFSKLQSLVPSCSVTDDASVDGLTVLWVWPSNEWMYTLGTAANKTTANKVTEKNILNFDFNRTNIQII